jgi:uncharacterized protein (TIGR04222 family)
MNFLLDNPIAAMDGTSFLVLFIVYIVITLAVLAVAKSNIDKTDRMPIPAIPPEIDPFEIAFLRGGDNELARSVVFSLVQKGLVEIVNSDKSGTIRRMEMQNDTLGLSSIEEVALGWIGASREAKEVFASGGLAERLHRHNAKYEIDLANRQFLMPDDWKSKAKKYGIAAALLIAGLGGYKILAAVLAGRFNIIFTIVLTVIAVVIAMTIGRLPRMTKLGTQYIARLQDAFEDLKLRAQAPYIAGGTQQPAMAQGGFAGVDPLLLSVGVFGTGILVGTMYSGYNDAFARQQAASSSGCGSSCGSSCGSGDGGGGSCGGGCGGCS